MLRVGLIGYGAITRRILENLPAIPDSECSVVGVLTRSGPRTENRTEKCPENSAESDFGVPVFSDLNELLACNPQVIAECAGREALNLYGAEILQKGISLVISSVGALADDAFFQSLKEASISGRSRLHLPAGAVGGIDALTALKIGGLSSVCYRARKPPSAWKGSPAELTTDLDKLCGEEIVYSGSAREAALRFPKNSNVAATIALAGLGFDKTRVELIADPTVSDNIHEIDAEGQAGRFHIRLNGRPSADNPRTSALTALSITRCLANLESSIVI